MAVNHSCMSGWKILNLIYKNQKSLDKRIIDINQMQMLW